MAGKAAPRRKAATNKPQTEKPPEAKSNGAPSTIMVPLSVFEAHRCCEPDASRYALGGIKFENDSKGRPYAIATDGRRMVVLSWNPSDGAPFDAIVSCKAFESVLDAVKKLGRGHNERGTVTPTSVEVEWKGRQKVAITAQPIEGNFPKWREVVPKITEQHVSFTLDAKMLIDILRVFQSIGDNDCRRGVVFTVLKGNEPVVMSLATEDVKACAVVMPMVNGGDESPPEKPEWLP